MRSEAHWLTQPRTIRRLWMVFVAILALTVFAEVADAIHGHFGIDSTFGFNAWYGFVTCVAMIVLAKLLGIFLQRKDIYYDE